MAHANSWSWHDPYQSRIDATMYDLYPLAFYYAHRTMIEKIDIILAHRPDAVIVVQSDHGMHYAETQNQMRNLGYFEQIIRYQLLSVLSSVRIPSPHDKQTIAPLNVSRVLINRFVGENFILR